MSRHVQYLLCFAVLILVPVTLNADLPVGNAPEPLAVPHFPSRMHTFIWRNWETCELDRIAEVLGTSVDTVREVGESMGLPPHQPISALQYERGYISVIRRNWHLLSYDQLLTLLKWDEERLAYTLKEDDFLWIKLGRHKPKCESLTYTPPTDVQLARCAEIKAIVQEHFGEALNKPAQPRFAFVDELSKPASEPSTPTSDDGSIRFIYSYFAVYGDPLLDPELDPYPNGLLQRLASLGVNGVWLHTVLRDLAPSDDFPEFGDRHETRLATLRGLVQRAKRYGIKIYLYMNEPRSMPAGFFDKYTEIAGAHEDPNVAMCTSVPKVRRYVEDGSAYVFKNVPDLGGVFTITMSENLTNCYSRGGGKQCPRCSKRSGAEIVAEINQSIARGVRRGNPDATVITWDWGWPDGWAEQIINHLPDDVYLMSVSEWSLPIERGGIKSAVGEYSISSVGPGPRATRHWSWAKDRGLKTLAKVQVNNTWELSAVPYLPTMNLVARHMHNLAQSGIDGQMLSWSLGGYPSPNLELAAELSQKPIPTIEQALRNVANRRYGKAATPEILEAWETFSEAFEEFPFHITTLYAGPQQRGPANLLFAEPSGYGASMVGFPYDDLTTWRRIYPAETFAEQFEKVAKGFEAGLELMRPAFDQADAQTHHENLVEDLRIAEAATIHFKSVANQARFVIARDSQPPDKKIMSERANREIANARGLFELTQQDARIGYEASNHYYYYPLDLVEKVVNCKYILE